MTTLVGCTVEQPKKSLNPPCSVSEKSCAQYNPALDLAPIYYSSNSCVLYSQFRQELYRAVLGQNDAEIVDLVNDSDTDVTEAGDSDFDEEVNNITSRRGSRRRGGGDSSGEAQPV